MTEYLPIFIFAGALLLVLAVVHQVRSAQKDCQPPKEPYKYSMSIDATKSALDLIMAEPVQLKGVELYWQPDGVTQGQNGRIVSRYKISFEYDSHTDSLGQKVRLKRLLTLVAKLEPADKETSLAEFSFEEVTYALGQYAESDYMKDETMSRIIQRLAQLSIHQQGLVQQTKEEPGSRIRLEEQESQVPPNS